MPSNHNPEFQPVGPSNQIFARVPVEVFGTDLMGIDFAEEGSAESITRKGATLNLNRSLGPGQEITINVNKGKECLGRVIGQAGKTDNVYAYSIALVDLHADFWGTAWEETETNSAGTLLLECM